MRLHPTPACRLRGFTLIEMLVLIIIIAVMAGVAVPSYSRFHARTEFTATTRSVANLLSWARDAAIQSNADTVVRFDAQTGTFTVTVQQSDQTQDEPAALQDSAQENQQAAQPRTMPLGENVQVQTFNVTPTGMVAQNQDNQQPQSQQELHFHDDGSADAATIVLTSLQGYAAQIVVMAATGRAVLQDDRDVQ